jgi:hypothetical protein
VSAGVVIADPSEEIAVVENADAGEFLVAGGHECLKPGIIRRVERNAVAPGFASTLKTSGAGPREP